MEPNSGCKYIVRKRVLEATNQMESHRQWFADEFRNLDGMVREGAQSAQSEAGSAGESYFSKDVTTRVWISRS
jgi:hypothetical protein